MSVDPEPVTTSPAPEYCTNCGAEIPPTGHYCPRCGALKPSARYAGLPVAGDRRHRAPQPTYYRPTRMNWRVVIKGISAFVMVTFIIQILVSLFTLIYGIHLVVPDILDVWKGYTLFLVIPVIVELVLLSGYALLVWYLFLVGAIVAACTWVLLSGYKGFAKELGMKAKSREHSAIFDTCGLMFATLFFSVLVVILLKPSAADVPSTGSLTENLFLLANASVWEEIAVRVLLIGLPMVAVDLARRDYRRKAYSYLLGGGFKLGIPEVSLIIISAMIFGFAHYLGGWGSWKIVPAAVGGFAFGYLFLRYGIAASIMLHFGTDYLSMPMEVFNSNGLTLLLSLAILVWLGFGLLFFVYYTVRVGEFFSGKKYMEGRSATAATPWSDPRMQVHAYYQPRETQHTVQVHYGPASGQIPQAPPPRQGFGGGYVCPICGYMQARWMDGKFQCLRCGHSG